MENRVGEGKSQYLQAFMFVELSSFTMYSPSRMALFTVTWYAPATEARAMTAKQHINLRYIDVFNECGTRVG